MTALITDVISCYVLTYSKTKFIDGVTELDLEFIGKLRHDASLRWLYEGNQKLLGRHKLYDGKVQFLMLRTHYKISITYVNPSFYKFRDF